MVTVMVTNETLNNNNGDKNRERQGKRKSVSQNAIKMVVEVWRMGRYKDKQTDGRRTNERAKWWPKEARETFILTAATSLVAGEAHGPAELALVRLQCSQTLQNLLGIPHRSGERTSSPIAIVVHYRRHVGFTHAST